MLARETERKREKVPPKGVLSHGNPFSISLSCSDFGPAYVPGTFVMPLSLVIELHVWTCGLLYNIFKVHLFLAYSTLFLSCDWIIFHCMIILHFINSLVDGHSGCFYFLILWIMLPWTFYVHIFVWAFLFFFGKIFAI